MKQEESELPYDLEELNRINTFADELNEEAEDVLNYQELLKSSVVREGIGKIQSQIR